jgi:23S rRNA (uridine2552-2'-O)-methyltransferase
MSGNYNRKDHLYKKAKAEGYRSRASYKLTELDKRFKLFSQNSNVLDLGCAPGGWLQISLELSAPNGTVVGVDLEEIEDFNEQEIKDRSSLSRLNIIVGDILDQDIQAKVRSAINGKFDLILSDMSPKLSGIKIRDVARSVELVQMSLDISKELLRPGGDLVAKTFPGNDCEKIIKEIRKFFTKLNIAKLQASRGTSTEIYIVAKDFKG